MGCGGSKDDPSERGSSNLDKNVVTTTSSSNKEFHHDKQKLDLKTSIDSPSPIELDPDEHIVNKSTKNQFDVKISENDKQHSPKTENAGQKNDSSGTVANAWTPPTQKNIKKEQVHVVNDIEEDSEFGRDGIDFCSESFDGIRKKSSDKRTKKTLSEIPSNIDNSIDVSPRLTKKQSEEPFDPRPLIDVDKFKAANTAAKEVRIVNNNNNTVTIETIANVEPPVGQPAPVVSPSNYQDFYDDDEKELMASIEQDFIPIGLPGVVT